MVFQLILIYIVDGYICCKVCVKLSNKRGGAVDEMEKVQISADVARFLKSKYKTRSVLSWTGPQNHTTKNIFCRFFIFLPKQDLNWAVSILNSVINTINAYFKMKLNMTNCTCLHISLGDPPLDTMYQFTTAAVKICLCWNQHKRFWNQYKSVT